MNSFVTRKTRIAEAALWAVAALVTIGMHVGAAAWILRSEPVIAADNAPPAAIMIEIADTPEALMTEKSEIAPDQSSAEQAVAHLEQKADEKVPEQVVEPEVTRPLEEKAIEEKIAPLEKVEVPLPAVQPEKEKPKEKPKPRKQQASAEAKAALQAQAQVRQSERTAAAQTASGLSSLSPANWQSRLMAHLERNKRYPAGARSRGERGIVYVRFAIDDAGNVQSAGLARSSGFSELDQEVLSLVRRASPVPAPPSGAQRIITAPVRFSTN
jgi:periplasmic protein TonB